MSTKMLPNLGGREGEQQAQQAGGEKLTRADLRRLAHLMTSDAMRASSRLYKLTEENPEEALQRGGLLIDTDPRHVGETPLQDLELPGVGVAPGQRPSSVPPKGRKGANRKESVAVKEKSESKTVLYATPDQIAAEEAALQDRIIYEMRQNLQKLKEYGKEIGITFDISKKKSQHGRMQGEKWHDEELDVWKKQAQRLIKTPPPADKQAAEEAPLTQKMSEYVFKLERIMNEMKYTRQRRQKQKETLENEISVQDELEQREQSGAGKMADMYGRLSTLKEKIQDTDQRILDEAASKKELTEKHDVLLTEAIANRNTIEGMEKAIKDYDHDTNILKLQLKDQMHDVEKVLGQGKLQTMMEVKDDIKERYKKELDQRQKAIKKQKAVKEQLEKHELRVTEMTKHLGEQYSQNRDSPRRNELKRKAVAFEEVFETMMKRIGESDITRIVELFQKQTLTMQAWEEAVRDQEIRVKALQDEKRNLEKQLTKVSSNKAQGISNETRQYTISGRKLDMEVERLDTASMRLMQLEGLIAHVKETVRQGMMRVNHLNKEVQVPPPIFPHEGEGGLLEWIDKFALTVSDMLPPEDEFEKLVNSSEKLNVPESPEKMQTPVAVPSSPAMPKKLRTALKAMADAAGEEEKTVHDEENDFNKRVTFPLPRVQQKAIQDKEREEDEQEARAEQLDESIVSRDEMKRRAMRMLKQKERERAEKDAFEKGEESPAKKKKNKKKAASGDD